MTTEATILGALARGEGYGLDIARRLEANGDDVPHQSTLNRTLRRMESDGLLMSRRGEPLPERGGRPRIYYTLTGDGVMALRAAADRAAGFLAGWELKNA